MKNFTYLLFLIALCVQSWSQIGNDINGEAAGDNFGFSVSLSANGSIVAIGASRNDGNGNDSGHVRVFQDVAGTWTQIGSDIDGEAAENDSGYSVSLSANGTIVAIGATVNSNSSGIFSGHVRVYENIAGTWTQIGSDIDGEAAYDNSGYAVSLSADGSIVAIGAPSNDGNGIGAGHVRVFENVMGTWTQIGSDIDGEASGDGAGYNVSLSADGSTVAIGARFNDGTGSSAGHVRVYKNMAGTWTQIGSDIDAESSFDNLSTVSLNANGSILAVGASLNDGSAGSSSFETKDAGHVRIYENQNGTWVQKGSDIDGEARDDRFGWAVSLSDDGSTVAIGGYLNDGAGLDAGHTRVYNLSELTLDLVDNDELLDFNLLPNPASDKVRIELSHKHSIKQIRITNDMGQLLLDTQSSEFDVSFLSSGIYFVQIETNLNKVVKKLIVK